MKNLVARGLVGCLCVFGTGLADAGINSWTTTGPQGGNFADMERSTTVPGTVYATLGHSFYRSLDGGRTWSGANTLPGWTEDIAVDPTDGRRVYVVVADKGVFRSEDAGNVRALPVVNGNNPAELSIGKYAAKLFRDAAGQPRLRLRE